MARHSSILVTLDTYYHVAPGLQAAAAARFDEVFNTQYNKAEIETIKKLGLANGKQIDSLSERSSINRLRPCSSGG